MGRDPQTGKYCQKWYGGFHDRGEALAFRRTLAGKRGDGAPLPSTVYTLSALFDEWLQTHAAQTQPTTYRSYLETVERHLRPAFGHLRLRDLTPGEIAGYLSAKRAERNKKEQPRYSTTTVRYHGLILRMILKWAAEMGKTTYNPATGVKLPAPERHDLRVLDEEQTRLFLATAKRYSAHYRLYLMATLTGMRQGELLGLRWQDVDLTRGTVTVQQTLYRMANAKKFGGDGVMFRAPKTAHSRRTLALAPVLVEQLLQIRTEQDETRRLLGSGYPDLDLVFCQPNGKPHHAHNIAQRDLPRVLKKASLPRIRFHDLRHCHASYLLLVGTPLKVVQERLGHSTAAFTMQTYAHLLPGMEEEASTRVAERLLGAPTRIEG
jgi:integrase